MLFFRSLENEHVCGLNGCYDKYKCPVCGRRDNLYSAPDFLFDVGFQGTFVRVIRCGDHVSTDDWMQGRDIPRDDIGWGEDKEGDKLSAILERKFRNWKPDNLTIEERRATMGPRKKKDWRGGKAP